MPRTHQTSSGRLGTVFVIAGVIILVLLGVLFALSNLLAHTASALAPRPAEAAESDSSTSADKNPLTAAVVDWGYWQSVNPDIVGWIKIAGTSIDLPIVKADREDPTYYLSHDVYGNWNYHGCPYVDADCPSGLDSKNVIILGHNLIDGTMFTEIERYHDESFASTHKDVIIYTPAGERRYVVSACETVAGDRAVKRTEFADETDFRAFVAERLSACTTKLASSPPDGNLLTLCTCSYYFNPANERTLVYAFQATR